MSSRRVKAETIPTPQVMESSSLIVAPNEGGNAIFSGWRFLFQVLGARVQKFELSDEGITVKGLTFPEQYNAEQIVNDISRRGDKILNPRTTLLPGYYWLSGLDPLPYTSSDDLTVDLTKLFHGANTIDGKGRSPEYAKNAVANYKAVQGFAVPRGRPRKMIAIAQIGELNEAVLKDVDPEEIAKLKETLAGMEPASA